MRWVNQYILEGRIPGCERFGHAWAVPENAIKPKRLTPGVKAKQSSSGSNADENIRKSFFVTKLVDTKKMEGICLSMNTETRMILSSCFLRR